MELHEALQQISDIRRQMARTEIFRGYRSATVGFSGILGVAAAVLQSRFLSSPETDLAAFLFLWVGVAAVSLVVVGVELSWRAYDSGGGLTREMTLLAVEQFLPSILAGGLLTLCIYKCAPHVGWMLPGLWSLIFGLGIFASHRLLPRGAIWIGIYYTVCAALCLMWGQGQQAFAPWQMGISFGGGQLLGAVVLYQTLERPRAAQEI